MAKVTDISLEKPERPRMKLNNDVLRSNRVRVRAMYEALQEISVWPPEYGSRAPDTILEIREFAKETLRKLDHNEL